MGTRGEEEHWDGTNLTERLLDEMADLSAAMNFVMDKNPFTLEQSRVYQRRVLDKYNLFCDWHEREDPPPSMTRDEALEALE